jgi:imidazolonepropionase-like amidohydrolase
MRFSVPTPRQLVVAVLASCIGIRLAAQQHPRASHDGRGLLLQHVQVFDPTSGAFTDTLDILIRGERIAAIGKLGPLGRGIAHVDAVGKYALPGLWDSHVHLSFLTLGGESAVATTLAAFVRHGITSVRDVGGQLDTIAGLSRRVALGSLLGPRIYFAGPLLTRAPILIADQNNALPGIAAVVETPAAVDSMLDRLVARGASMTKAIDHWDPALFRYYLQAARARSLRVVWDAGLPIVNWIPIDTALALGVTSIEHAKAVWSGVLRDDLAREYDSVMAAGGTNASHEAVMLRLMALGDQSVSRERLAALAERWARSGAYFCPTLQVAVDNLARTPSGAYQRPFAGLLAVSWLFVRELAAHRVRMLVGQDNIEPDGTLREMDLLASAGVSPVEILRGATIYPARWLGVDSTVGTLEPGKRADILILEANPLERIANIRSAWAVVHDGKLVFGPRTKQP